jgi:hypothetical protein
MGEQQEIETLINEDALLSAMFLRNEKQTWRPRTPELPSLARVIVSRTRGGNRWRSDEC